LELRRKWMVAVVSLAEYLDGVAAKRLGEQD
jgi:hypothetical protein